MAAVCVCVLCLFVGCTRMGGEGRSNAPGGSKVGREGINLIGHEPQRLPFFFRAITNRNRGEERRGGGCVLFSCKSCSHGGGRGGRGR